MELPPNIVFLSKDRSQQDEMQHLGLPRIHCSTISKYLCCSGLLLRFLKRKAKEHCEVEMEQFLEQIKKLS